MSGWEIAFIVMIVLLVLACLAAAGVLIFRYRRRQTERNEKGAAEARRAGWLDRGRLASWFPGRLSADKDGPAVPSTPGTPIITRTDNFSPDTWTSSVQTSAAPAQSRHGSPPSSPSSRVLFSTSRAAEVMAALEAAALEHSPSPAPSPLSPALRPWSQRGAEASHPAVVMPEIEMSIDLSTPASPVVLSRVENRSSASFNNRTESFFTGIPSADTTARDLEAVGVVNAEDEARMRV